MKTFKTINPYSGVVLQEYTYLENSQLLVQLDQGQKAFTGWRKSSDLERKNAMLKLAHLIRQERSKLARLATLEMGKLYPESLGEVDKCAWLADYFGEHFQEYLAPEELQADGKRHFISFEPLGIILGIMPWNFPYWQIMRFCVPAILAGNSVIIKPALETPQCALQLEQLFRQAGFPQGVFQVSLASHEQVSEVFMPDFRIRGVAFTGSTEGGRKVYAASASNLKKVVLELGGSDPFVVMPDADLQSTVKGAVAGRLLNCGQSCIGSKRFYIHKSIYEEFMQLLQKQFQQLRAGDPLLETTGLAPLFSRRGFDLLQAQVQQAIKEGARVRFGGDFSQPPFVTAAVLEGVKPNMEIARQELFGPILMAFSFESEEELVERCNDTPYGLGASLWGKDQERLLRISKQLEVGNVFINSITKSDPRIPFGGTKFSGVGKELGKLGIREFCNNKTINIF